VGEEPPRDLRRELSRIPRAAARVPTALRGPRVYALLRA
jgi:hypothetical protein